MTPAQFFRQLWIGHRLGVMSVSLLFLANVVLLLVLQQYLVPKVSERERRLIQVQSEVRGGSGVATSPEQFFAMGERDLEIFRKQLPAYREFTGLLAELQEMADSAGLEIDRITYKSDENKGNRQLRYGLTFAVTGRYRDIKHFIHAIEQSPRLMAIQQIGLREVSQEDLPLVRLQLNLETYFDRGAK